MMDHHKSDKMDLDENDIQECSNLRQEIFDFGPDGPRTPYHLWATENPAARTFGTRFGWAFNMPRPVDRIGQYDTSEWEGIRVSRKEPNFGGELSTGGSRGEVLGGVTRPMNRQPSPPQESKRAKIQFHNKVHFDESNMDHSKYADFQSQSYNRSHDDAATVVTNSSGGSILSGGSIPQSETTTLSVTTPMDTDQIHNSQQFETSNATVVTDASTSVSSFRSVAPSAAGTISSLSSTGQPVPSPDTVPKAILYAAYGKHRT